MSQRILCIDDDPDFLLALKVQLKAVGDVVTAASLTQALEVLKREPFDLILLDIGFPGESGITSIKTIKEAMPDVDVVMLSGERDPKIIVEAMREGAVDYLTKPFVAEELVTIVQKAARNRQVRERYEALVEAQNPNGGRHDIIFASRTMQKILSQAEQLKGHQANVFIVGETGTGKELLARFIHRLEGNPQRPFVAVNCAAIPENLLEAELFGAERGSYTGAVARRIGLFELADGGDIFLDEIGCLKLDLQAKILRVLQEKEFTRVGGTSTIRANFRVLAATNDNLDHQVTSGVFRIDLYHRLRVIQLTVPPLRERSEDIPVLVEHFLKKYGAKREPKKLSKGALERLMIYHWPGNVRELENVVHSLMILAAENVIEVHHLPSWAMNGIAGPGFDAGAVRPPTIQQTVVSLKDYHVNAERQYIEHVLRSAGGDKSKAARVLDVGRTTLYAKLKEYGLM